MSLEYTWNNYEIKSNEKDSEIIVYGFLIILKLMLPTLNNFEYEIIFILRNKVNIKWALHDLINITKSFKRYFTINMHIIFASGA